MRLCQDDEDVVFSKWPRPTSCFVQEIKAGDLSFDYSRPRN